MARRPRHIPPNCPACKTALVPYDTLLPPPAGFPPTSDFICPQCEDRVWPDERWFPALAARVKELNDQIDGKHEQE